MNNTRKNNLDVLRVLAALSVVVYHVLGSSANNDPEVPKNLYSIATAFSSALQWHVPVFFMITGYLWLSDEKICTFAKMLPNIRRFFLVLFTFGWGYAILERFFVTKAVSVTLFTASLQDVFTGNLWDHMWFVYSIIGVYLVLPVFKPFFANVSLKAIATLTGLLFLFTIVFPVLQDGSGYALPICLPIQEPMFYLCAGGLIAKWNPVQKKGAIVSVILFFCSILAMFVIVMYANKYAFFIPLLISISAVSLFVAITVFMKDAQDISWVRRISDCTFGIYLLHPLFINVMIKLLHLYPLRWMPFVSIIGASVAIAGLSYGCTYLLRKIRWIRKYIL